MSVSCLMVTQACRLDFARQALQDFARQTHYDRELLVSTTDSGENLQRVRELVQAHAGLGVRWVGPAERESPVPLGQARNETLAAATRPYCCTWDDDDRHHPERVEQQLQALEQVPGAVLSCLTEQLHWFRALGRLYWLRWNQAWSPGVILFRRQPDVLYEPARNQHEDTMLFRLLRARGAAVPVRGRPGLYCRTYHGANTSGERHHMALVRSYARTWVGLQNDFRELAPDLATLQLPGPLGLYGRQHELVWQIS